MTFWKYLQLFGGGLSLPFVLPYIFSSIGFSFTIFVNTHNEYNLVRWCILSCPYNDIILLIEYKKKL